MKRFSVHLLLTVLLTSIFSLSQSLVPQSSLEVNGAQYQGQTIDVLATLARNYQVVIGVYLTHVGSDNKTVKVSIDKGKLKDVFDAIVAQDPRFTWTETGGSIHFSSKSSPLNLPAVTLRSVALENPSRIGIVGIVRQIPEISSWLQKHNCQMDEFVAGRVPTEWPRNFSVSVSDVSFASLLDQIAAKSGTYFWSAIQYRTQPCAINVTP